MASVNRESLRRSFDEQKRTFERLKRDGAMTPESIALIDALMTLLELLIAVFMEKTTTKTGRNSGLPSSRAPQDETARGAPGARGRGPKENAAAAANTRVVTGREESVVEQCWSCGADLAGAACAGHERRTLIDIVFETVEHHVDAQIKRCPRCRAETRGRFPGNMPGPLQYGPGIRAWAVHLLVAQMVSLKRVAQSLKVLTGRAVAEATLLSYIAKLHQALAQWEDAAVERLLAMPAIHVDETSLRVDRKNHWIHVYAAGGITLKVLHPRRGCEAIEAIGIIPRYQGVLIHDCWASYLSYGHCRHALCGAHLARELAFVVEAHGHAWARRMRSLLLDACHQVAQRDDRTLSAKQYKALRRRYRTILTQAKRELPEIPPRADGQRGRIAKSDAHNLRERLKTYETEVLRFAQDPDVSFTNNRAERDLRMSKVKQKVSGCFRTGTYAHAWCRISSYLQSAAAQGYNPLVAIQIALAGNAANLIDNPQQPESQITNQK